MEEPDLLPENQETVRLWALVHDQVRLGPDGSVLGMDLGAIAQVVGVIGSQDPSWELEKIQLLGRLIYSRKRERNGSSRQRSPGDQG